MQPDNETIRTVDFSEKDEPLRADVSSLGALVGDVIREQSGEALFNTVEEIRKAAIRRRDGDQGGPSLLDLLDGLESATVQELVRAFATYFQVVNLAEQVHRIRRGRTYLMHDGPPQSGATLPTR